MASQLGTFVELNATGEAEVLTFVADVQLLRTYAQQFLAQLTKCLGQANNMISGATTANIETAAGLISGQNNGTTLFNMLNGSNQAVTGQATNSQVQNLAYQVGG